MVEGRCGEHGVAVLMRYTLRLLTLQQFQRATALMCACESIRREALEAGDARWGREPFRIGLWVGADHAQIRPSTPRGAQAAHGAGKPRAAGAGWARRCSSRTARGAAASIEQGRACVRGYGGGTGRTLMFCGDPRGACLFSRGRRPRTRACPVVVVDEEIYRRLPTLLIATVDKFAQMPWNGEVQMLFGQVDGLCPRHGFRSPDDLRTRTTPDGRTARRSRLTRTSRCARRT